MRENLNEVLDGVAFLAPLSSDQKRQVAERASLQVFEEGAVFWRKGEVREVLYVLISGRIEILPEKSSLVSVKAFRPGDVINGLSLYEDRCQPSLVSWIASEPCCCVVIEKRDFFALLEAVPPLLRCMAPHLPVEWYHTIDFGDGIVSDGQYDHRSILHRYPIPPSLAGKSTMDVGTADGFFAFEMERRGADRVLAIDIDSWLDFDWLPSRKKRMAAEFTQAAAVSPARRFQLARDVKGSRVERQVCNVYDLGPDRFGMFDVVFCGALLLHLQNPLRALCNIRSVTRELAILETTLAAELEESVPGVACATFGHREHETTLGEACVYWRWNSRGLEEMLYYAGFSKVSVQQTFVLPYGKGITGVRPQDGLQVVAMAAHP